MERLTSGALQELLGRLSPTIEAGSVNVISLAAIRDRSGDKWARRREQVEAFVERTFSRLSPPGGFVVALNDLELLAIQPDLSRWAALGVSASVLKETLTFFLGEAAREDMRLYMVTGVTGGELAVEAVHGAALDQCQAQAGGGAGDEPRNFARTPALPIQTPLCLPARSARIAGSAGQQLELHLQAEPSWNIRDRVVTSFAIHNRLTALNPRLQGLPASIAQLQTQAAYDVARLNLGYAVDLIEQGRSCDRAVAIHVPFPWSALSNGETRLMLLRRLAELDPRTRRLIVAEITGLAAGVPPGRLAEVVALLSPQCRAVLARAASEQEDLLGWRRCGLNGITVDCAGIDPSDRTAHARLSNFARRAGALAPACVGYGLNTRSLIVAAWSAGFTHLSGAAVSAEAAMLGAMRLAPADLYKAETTAGGPAPASWSVALGETRV